MNYYFYTCNSGLYQYATAATAIAEVRAELESQIDEPILTVFEVGDPVGTQSILDNLRDEVNRICDSAIRAITG